jgi:Tol biopolymer transport system component
MHADGTGLERVTSEMSNWAPQFSRDGRLLLVQINRDVWTIDLATRERRQLTFDPQNGMNPTWSPDNSRIAYVTTRNKKAEIFVANADGTGARSLVTMASASVIDPRWSPAGTHVAFVMLPDSSGPEESAATVPAIYTIEVASGTVTRISP